MAKLRGRKHSFPFFPPFPLCDEEPIIRILLLKWLLHRKDTESTCCIGALITTTWANRLSWKWFCYLRSSLQPWMCRPGHWPALPCAGMVARDYLQVSISYGCSKQLVTEAMKGQELCINRKANVYLSVLLSSPFFYPLSKNKVHCSQGVEFEVAAVCLADSFPKSWAQGSNQG